LLNAEAIAALVPQQGSMCLLTRVVAFDSGSITCEAGTHRYPDNPLRRMGRLAGVCTVEYGLQAMALHGALTAGARQPPGFVASLRNVRIERAYADDLPAPLTVEAFLSASEARGFLYRFAVRAGTLPVSRGEATILLPASSPCS
jgi:predicted hotdog family 3-hydroxylacyl-ACP dehydratase